jgi:tryptophan 7-halogenase
MTHSRIEQIVIVGGGTAGWMSAAVLARAMGSKVNIKLIESDAIGRIGVGEATIPQIHNINKYLGFDEDDFIRQTQASFKLGIQFKGWTGPKDAYLHAFGDIGLPLGLTPFHHYWLRARDGGKAASLWDYSINNQSAMQNRFARLDHVGQSRLGGIKYAYHFDANLYALYLGKSAQANGVERIEGKIVDVNLRADDGFIESLRMENGDTIKGDLFIDCSGFRALLIEGALKSGYVDWSHWLPCDRAQAIPSIKTSPMRPYTQSIAHKAGWQWRIPLQHRTGNGLVYCSQYLSDDEAISALMDNLESEALDAPRLVKFTTGRREKFWHKNCVAIGLSSGFMEPLESTSIHLFQSSVSRLLAMFPDKNFDPTLRDEYNRQTVFEFERIRDFLILHYHANGRKGEPFWDACRNMQIPQSLSRKIDLFRQSGRIFREHEELFTETGWLQVLLGQQIMPGSYHPLADDITPDQLAEFLGNIQTLINREVDNMPGHEDFIAGHCAAPQL